MSEQLSSWNLAAAGGERVSVKIETVQGRSGRGLLQSLAAVQPAPTDEHGTDYSFQPPIPPAAPSRATSFKGWDTAATDSRGAQKGRIALHQLKSGKGERVGISIEQFD